MSNITTNQIQSRGFSEVSAPRQLNQYTGQSISESPFGRGNQNFTNIANQQIGRISPPPICGTGLMPICPPPPPICPTPITVCPPEPWCPPDPWCPEPPICPPDPWCDPWKPTPYDGGWCGMP